MLTAHSARNEELWDAFVRTNGGNFLQSWAWSRFQESVGRQAFRVRIDEPGRDSGDTHEDTVVQFLTVQHSLPFGMRYAYVPRGPIIRHGGAADQTRCFETFVGALRDHMARERCLFARVELPNLQGEPVVNPGLLEGFGFRHVKSVQPADTSIVDLAPNEEQLLAAMHPKTRYNIRVAERHGVVIRDAAYGNAHHFRHDVELFWRLLDETAVRDRFHTHSQQYYEGMLDVLSPKKNGGLIARLVFAEYQGIPVAAAIIAEFGDTVTYLHGASAASYRQVMAPHLLHWEIIREAKRRGFAKYDFWGVAPTDDAEHPWAGITRFKRGFGGRRESYLGAWELPNNPVWYNLYRYAKRFRNI